MPVSTKLNLYKSLSSPVFKIWAPSLDDAKTQCLCVLLMLKKRHTYRGIRKVDSSILESEKKNAL